jgi:homoserine kinase
MTGNESQTARAFAPATIANLGPGFDLIGLALHSPGDTVSITLETGQSGISVVSIEGDGGRLPDDPTKNTAAVAVSEIIKKSEQPLTSAVKISIKKGLPLGSGLGSSGASAVAAAVAMNALLNDELNSTQLLDACRCAEAVACGAPHGDNVAPALFGGIVLLPQGTDVAPISLPVPSGLFFAVAHPDVEVRTEQARAVLPREVPLSKAVFNAGQLGHLVSALYEEDLEGLGKAMVEGIVTPVRSALIPGFSEVCEAALKAGALGVGISGSGPTLFAMTRGESVATEAAEAMGEAFHRLGISATSWSSSVSQTGAYLL